jgi:chorismate synthase
MEVKGKPLNESLNPHGREAQMNLERCLEALDTNGEAGLQAELDRLYPGTKASPPPLQETERVEIAPGMWATIVKGKPLIPTKIPPKEAEPTE